MGGASSAPGKRRWLGRIGQPDAWILGLTAATLLAIAISMDSRGARQDNGFVERPWRAARCEEVYLRAYGSVSDARASLGRHLDFCNAGRPPSCPVLRMPEQAYPARWPHRMAA